MRVRDLLLELAMFDLDHEVVDVAGEPLVGVRVPETLVKTSAPAAVTLVFGEAQEPR